MFSSSIRLGFHVHTFCGFLHGYKRSCLFTTTLLARNNSWIKTPVEMSSKQTSGGKAQGEHQKNTVAGATLVTKNARLIIQQEDIATIKEIPNLPTHQKAAKTQSNKWLHDIWPLIIKTTTEIIDYANTFQASITQLNDLIPKLEKGDKKAKDDFVQVLEVILIPALKEKSKTARDIATSVSKFHDNFEPLYNEFAADFTKANDLMTHDKQEIREKQAQEKQWEAKARAYEISVIALGIALPVTAAATVAFSETGVGLLIGAVLMVGELSAIGALLGEYADATQHVNDLTNEIDSLNKQVCQLTLIEKQISGLQKHSQQVVTFTAKVADGWVALHEDLQDTVKHFQKATPNEAAILIKIQLAAANKEWGIALEQAKTLQPSGGQLEQKKFKTSDDMMKAIKAQVKGA